MMQGTSTEKKRFEDMKQALENKNYEILKSIGKGAFGQVLLGRNRTNDQYYAIKIISKAHIRKKPFLQKYIDQEIDIMKKLNHPNIVKYQLEFTTSQFIIIVMEYCDQGNLLTYQSKLPDKVFQVKQAVRVIVQVMKGLKCIHQKSFVHRDIKSQNILLKKAGSDTAFKIADFGFARSIGGSGAKTHCGTQKYMAPQILSNSYYGISVDIWALGVLFYFMLFAQYPFKGQQLKADQINRCSNPSFSLMKNLSKKQKLKQRQADLQDFFRKIFVIDSKKRLTFSNIVKHPLFIDYQSEFKQNIIFYDQIQKNAQTFKDEADKFQYGQESEMQPQDQTRAILLKKQPINSSNKHLQRQLEEIFFEIAKTSYLKQCATQLFDNYASYLSLPQRLAAKYYLLKAYLFYSQPLLQDLTNGKMPESLSQVQINGKTWLQCTKTEEYQKMVEKMSYENMKSKELFDDAYNSILPVLKDMPIKNFEKGFKPIVTQTNFDELKFSYRSTTSYIFKSIHQNTKIDPHTRNKIKMRLFCCHMVNRIFIRKQIGEHFPFFIKWLKAKNIIYPHTFDFIYFRKWIYEQTQQNLERNIALLHKTFF